MLNKNGLNFVTCEQTLTQKLSEWAKKFLMILNKFLFDPLNKNGANEQKIKVAQNHIKHISE